MLVNFKFEYSFVNSCILQDIPFSKTFLVVPVDAELIRLLNSAESRGVLKKFSNSHKTETMLWTKRSFH